MTDSIVYVLMTGHDMGYKRPERVSPDKTKLDAAAHAFFLSYGFELKNGKPYDSGNEDGATGGFDVFNDVEMEGEQVVQFVHCGGEGPVCEIVEVPFIGRQDEA